MSATLKDVARAAGVHYTLVSKVLNHTGVAVRPETRQKILDAVAALHYRPSSSARALRLGQSELLGLVVGDLTNEFYAHYADAALAEAEKHGCRLIIGIARDGDAERVVRDLRREPLRGIVSCFPAADDDPACPVCEPVPFTRGGMRAPLRQAAAYFAKRKCSTSATLYTNRHWQETLAGSGLQTFLPGPCDLAAATAEARLQQLRKICAARPDVIFTAGWQCGEMLCDLLDREFPDYYPEILLSANCRGPFLDRERITGVFYHSTRDAIARAVARLAAPDRPAAAPHAAKFILRGTPEYRELRSHTFQLT